MRLYRVALDDIGQPKGYVFPRVEAENDQAAKEMVARAVYGDGSDELIADGSRWCIVQELREDGRPIEWPEHAEDYEVREVPGG